MGAAGAAWSLNDVLGLVPAIVFPVASAIQLVAMIRARSGRGVSALTWSLFALANVCLYLYIRKYDQPQALATTLGTAAIQVAVVVLAVRWRDKAK